jgi:plasmid stabilization system protein ParE
MTTLSFFFHPEALEEAEAAFRWYRERSPLTAARFVAELNQVIDRILEAPTRWPHGPEGMRKLKLPCFPFLVIYACSGREIQLLAIAHGSRHPGYWKNRL